MGWFSEQISERRKADDSVFEESFLEMAGAVMGRRLSESLNDDRQQAEDAIGEILKYYRVKPREVPEDITDMNEVLEYLLQPSGIMRRTVVLDGKWYHDAVGAMIGKRTDDGRLVALIPCGLNSYRFLDRKTGKMVRLNSKNRALIDREAIAFYKPFPLKKMSMLSLIRYMFGQLTCADYVMIVLSILAVTLVGMLMPKLQATLFSDVLMSKNGLALIGMAIFMASVTISGIMLGAVRALITTRLNTKLHLSVEAATMMRVLTLPATFFKDYSSGELSRRSQYMNALSDQLVNMVLSTGLTSLFSLLYITQIFIFAPALVVPALLVTVLSVVIMIVQILLQIRISRQLMEVSTKESGLSYQLISGIQKIRLSGAEKRAFAKWGKLYSKEAALAYNPPTILKTASVLTLAVSLTGTMVLYYAAIMSGVSVAEYFAFQSAYGMINGAILSLASIAGTIASIRPTLEMARPIMETVPEVTKDKQVLTSLSGSIELNSITFRYSDDMPAVLDNLSLKIRSGQYVAIVGKTGCGKSTLMRIMLGFETPQKGAVYYDGIDLETIDLKSLRRRIGTVMQNGKMFTGDIYSNITISAPWLTMDEAWEAAELAGMGDDIREMPMGMHTLISEGQGGISGGQRQRLLIARAIAPKPKVLMFDEATSALDNLTQKRVSKSLDEMKCTRIVIAHRLSTIRQCDRIIVLDNGKIIEDGNYDELMKKDGYFADLVARQRLDDTAYVGRTTMF